MTLLEDTDNLVNMYKGHLFGLSIQRPDIPAEFHRGFGDLVDAVMDIHKVIRRRRSVWA